MKKIILLIAIGCCLYSCGGNNDYRNKTLQFIKATFPNSIIYKDVAYDNVFYINDSSGLKRVIIDADVTRIYNIETYLKIK